MQKKKLTENQITTNKDYFVYFYCYNYIHLTLKLTISLNVSNMSQWARISFELEIEIYEFILCIVTLKLIQQCI